jgi:hypothetical protein
LCRSTPTHIFWTASTDSPCTWQRSRLGVRSGVHFVTHFLPLSCSSPHLQGLDGVLASLLDEGVGVNSGTAASGRALHWAVRGVRDKAVRLLLARGADPNLSEQADDTVEQETPLDVAYSLQLWDCAAVLVRGGASTQRLLADRAAAVIQALWHMHRSAASSDASARVWAIMGVNKRHHRAVQMESEARRLGLSTPAQGWFRGASREERMAVSDPAMIPTDTKKTASPVLSRALVRHEMKKEVVQNLRARCTGLHEALAESQAALSGGKALTREQRLQLHTRLRRALGDAVRLRSDAGRVKED